MARKKKETVSMDEVREEIAQAPAEAEEPGEVTEATNLEGEGEAGQEESATDEVEAEATEEDALTDEAPAETAFIEGEAYKVINDSRIVRVELTKDELIEQGRIMIEALDEAERARASMKAHSAECKANEEAAREKAGEAKALMRARSEERSVKCHQIHNWTRDKVYTVRLDTGEIIGVRDMNNYERQTEIHEASPEEAEEAEEAQTEIDTEAGQAEPEAEEAPEAQADSDAVDDLDFDGESEAEGDLVGVGAGDDEGEI